MSRCFPFPAPCYERKDIGAMIESTKREEKKAKKFRKARRKEEKKQRKRARENGLRESKERSHKIHHRDEGTNEFQKLGDYQGSKVDEHLGKITDESTKKYQLQKVEEIVEHLMKKRNVMEEHTRPIGYQNSCDSTHNSTKREKLSSPANCCHINNSESIIWIRLPVKRLKDPEVLTNEEQQKPCSSGGSVDNHASLKMHKPASVSGPQCIEHQPSDVANIASVSTIRLREKKPSPVARFLERPTLNARKEQSQTPLVSSKFPEQKPVTAQPPKIPACLAVQFQDLIENWVPFPATRAVIDFDDEEWVLMPKCVSPNSNSRRFETSSFTDNRASASEWPSACLLPEADIYALPFALPF